MRLSEKQKRCMKNCFFNFFAEKPIVLRSNMSFLEILILVC